MAGDWIKVRASLVGDLRVFKLAKLVGLDPDTVLGKLVRFWVWADSQTVDGTLPPCDQSVIDALTGCAGFAQALISIDWLNLSDDYAEIPRFEEHNGRSAKRRVTKSAHMRQIRAVRGPDESTHGPQSAHAAPTKCPPEKRREESKESIPPNPPRGVPSAKPIEVAFPPELDAPEFREAWARWAKHRSEIRKPLKTTMIAAQLKRLAPWGVGTAVQVIDHAIAKGWQGLRFPDEDGGPPNAQGSRLPRPGTVGGGSGAHESIDARIDRIVREQGLQS